MNYTNEVKKVISMKELKTIELHYQTHCAIEVEKLDSYNYFVDGDVKECWVKHGTLYIKLNDGDIIEEDVTYFVQDVYDNVDTKWPTAIMLEDKKGRWYEGDYNE